MIRISQKDFFSDYGGLDKLNKLEEFCEKGIETTRPEKKGFLRFGKETFTKHENREVRTAHIAKILQQDFKAASEAKNAGDKAKLAQIAENLLRSEQATIGKKKPNQKQDARIALYQLL